MVVAHDSAGLAHITAALSLQGQVLGVVLAGQVFDQHPDELRIHRVARELKISATELWQVADRQQPLSPATLVAYGDLLMILAQAFLAQRYSGILGREISEVNRRCRYLLEGAPDYGLFMMDPKGDVISWNSGAQRVLGYSEQAILGGQGSILFTPEDIQQGLPEQELKSATSGEKTAREGWSVRKNGSQFRGDSLVTAVWENGVLQGFAKILHDVTERKLAQDQFANSLREKEILLQEVHHRVKNNLQVILSLLRLQASYSNDPAIVKILEESQGRVQAIANVHQMLSGTENLARIDFSVYLRELAEKLFLLYGMQSERIQLVFDLEPALLGMDKAVSCGLIANELLSNIFKHAFPSGRSGKLTIGFRCAWPEGARLVVSDDGVGLPPGQDFRKPKTLGLELVDLLVEQLSGKIELDSSHGVRFEITFPVTVDGTKDKNP